MESLILELLQIGNVHMKKVVLMPSLLSKEDQLCIRKLNKSELSELERLRLENRALHVEVEYLKKLDALVQKRGHLKKKDESSQN